MKRMFVAGTGVCTVAGDTMDRVRATIDHREMMARNTHLTGLDGNKIRAANVLMLQIRGAYTRIMEMCRRALKQCVTRRPADDRNVAVIACSHSVPSPTSDPRAWPAEFLARMLEVHHGISVPARNQFTIGHEHASGIVALSRAQEIIDSEWATDVIIVGADTLCTDVSLQFNDIERLTSSLRAPDGYIPGEAAAALWLSAKDPGPSLGGWSFSEEPPGQAQPSALGAALQHAFAQWGGAPKSIQNVYVDLNGGAMRAQSFAMAAMDSLWRRAAMPSLVIPAVALGNVGAATAPLLLALASEAATHSQQPQVVLASASGAMRAAAIVVPNQPV